MESPLTMECLRNLASLWSGKSSAIVGAAAFFAGQGRAGDE